MTLREMKGVGSVGSSAEGSGNVMMAVDMFLRCAGSIRKFGFSEHGRQVRHVMISLLGLTVSAESDARTPHEFGRH